MPITDKKTLKKIISIAQGAMPADIVLKGCHIVDVINQRVIDGDIAIADGLIAGIGGPYVGVQ